MNHHQHHNHHQLASLLFGALRPGPRSPSSQREYAQQSRGGEEKGKLDLNLFNT